MNRSFLRIASPRLVTSRDHSEEGSCYRSLLWQSVLKKDGEMAELRLHQRLLPAGRRRVGAAPLSPFKVYQHLEK